MLFCKELLFRSRMLRETSNTKIMTVIKFGIDVIST